MVQAQFGALENALFFELFKVCMLCHLVVHLGLLELDRGLASKALISQCSALIANYGDLSIDLTCKLL